MSTTATINDIADAVVSELNVASRFVVDLESERTYQPIFELKVLAGLKVSVVPRTENDMRSDRKRWQQEYRIDVAWQQKTDRTKEQLDPLVALVQSAKEFFQDETMPRPLESMPQMVLVSAEIDPVFDPGHLDEQGVFISILTLTFREWR